MITIDIKKICEEYNKQFKTEYNGKTETQIQILSC